MNTVGTGDGMRYGTFLGGGGWTRPFSDCCRMILRCAGGSSNKAVAVARCRIAPNLTHRCRHCFLAAAPDAGSACRVRRGRRSPGSGEPEGPLVRQRHKVPRSRSQVVPSHRTRRPVVVQSLPSGGNGGAMPATCELSLSVIGLRPGIVATLRTVEGKGCLEPVGRGVAS